MLQNAYLVAKIGDDTAENERNFAEICQKFAFIWPSRGAERTRAPPDGDLRPLPRPAPRPAVRVPGRRLPERHRPRWSHFFENFCKFLAGSFSAVSKRNFARKYAFDSIFQALQDVHTFAPLRSQNFRKKRFEKISNFREKSDLNSANILQKNTSHRISDFCILKSDLRKSPWTSKNTSHKLNTKLTVVLTTVTAKSVTTLWHFLCVIIAALAFTDFLLGSY